MTTVKAQVDEQTVKDAEAVLQPMGLSTSAVIRLLIVKIAKDKALPFEPLEPNETTIEAMKAARRGGLPKFKTVKDLMAHLDEDN
jgi:DNA-damage-inducible protein J